MVASKYRTKVMKSLNEETKMPSKIAKDTNIRINYMSNTLRELKEHRLAECINPEVRKGRLSRLTDLGEEIADNLE